MKSKNVLIEEEGGICHIGSFSLMQLMAIDAGQYRKVDGKSSVRGWGKDFDGAEREAWKLDGARWTFVLPKWVKNPKGII